MNDLKKILITGGGGYVGSVLTPQLLNAGYHVRVLDLFTYGRDVLKDHENLECITGDLRNPVTVREAVKDIDAVIHLACISNDPSFELDPDLGKSINFDAFEPLVRYAREAGARRFIYASSSSVYGISDKANVTEKHALKPLTDYSKFKEMCEPILFKYQSRDFTCTVIRPATVCGYSPRQRLDLTVNILTSHAYHHGKITVFGGSQLRPNLHIQDMTRLYQQLLIQPAGDIAGKTWNAGYENHSVGDIAQMVKKVVESELPNREPIEIETTPSNDLRSYHICSDKIAKDIGFKPTHTIEDAVRDLVIAFRENKIPDALTDERYFNVKMLKGQMQSAAA